jgi:hypothetical protein
MRRIVDLDRLRTPTSSLNLSRIPRDILHQALTPPAASFGYDYQRLETLGDNVLKILTTVCLFQQYPLKHEGALDSHRMVCVSNKYLRRRGFDMGLGSWLCGEEVLIRRWEPPIVGPHSVIVKRKWLQDCLEGGSWLMCRRLEASSDPRILLFQHCWAQLISPVAFLPPFNSVRSSVCALAASTCGISTLSLRQAYKRGVLMHCEVCSKYSVINSSRSGCWLKR